MTRDLETARRALSCLDLTNLDAACISADVEILIDKSVTPFGSVAAICIWPQFVAAARARLPSHIHLASVVNFPSGDESVQVVCQATRRALADGADEIDLVLPWRALRDGNLTQACEMLSVVAREIKPPNRLKVILETGELKEPHLITQASRLAIECGADFLKTSTGKTPVSATPEAARLMLEVIRNSGKPIGFKASGGIRTFADAKLYLDLCDEIMGPNWARPSTFRIGASSLLDALLERLRA